MADSNHVQPQKLPLLARVGWRLDPDPAAVAQLCAPLPAKVAEHWLFPDPGKVVRPLPAEVANQIIEREAGLLKRHNILRALASRADEEREKRKEMAIAAAVRKWRAKAFREWRAQGVVAGKLSARYRWYRHRSLSRLHKRLWAENKTKDRAIAAAICDVLEEARNGKWQAFGLDPETRKRVQIDRAAFTGLETPLRHVLENRVGSYEAVTLEPAAVEGGLVEKAPPQKGNPPRGYEIADRPLVAEIIELYRAGHCKSLLEAAQSVAHQAKGGGELKSKETRLHRRANQEWRRGGWQKIAEA